MGHKINAVPVSMGGMEGSGNFGHRLEDPP